MRRVPCCVLQRISSQHAGLRDRPPLPPPLGWGSSRDLLPGAGRCALLNSPQHQTSSAIPTFVKLARAKNTTEVRSCLSLAKQGRASPARLLSMDISQVRGERKFVPDCLVAGQLGRNICIFLKNSSPSTFVFLLTSSAIILIQPNNNVPSVLTGPTLTRKQRTSGIRQNSTTNTPCHPTNSGTESTRSSVSGGIYSQGASRNWACRVRRPQRHDG